MKTPKKNPGGRPTTGRTEPYTTKVTPDHKEWLSSRKNAAADIEQMIDRKIGEEDVSN